MPYIKQEDRKRLDAFIDALANQLAASKPGEFNYVITRLIAFRMAENPSYTEANAMIGMLECVKQEFYRRLVMKYEDGKMVENGDVPEYDSELGHDPLGLHP